MDDEPHSQEFSFPKIAQVQSDDGSVHLSRSIWLPHSTTTTTRAAAAAVSECCSFPTCPHNIEMANHLISTSTKEEEDQVGEGRTPRSSTAIPKPTLKLISTSTKEEEDQVGEGRTPRSSTAIPKPTLKLISTSTKEEEDQVGEGRTPRSSTAIPKSTLKLPRSPTTTSPKALFPMDGMWEDQDDASSGVTPSRRRRSLLSGSATPRSFTAEDLAEERMDMLWEEYQEHEELVATGIMCQFFKKQWVDDDDDTDDNDDDDGESSPYTASHSSSSSTATSATVTATATNDPGSTPEMISRLCRGQVMQMSTGSSPAIAVMPLRKPGLRVILKVLKKLFLLHHSHHHRSSRAKRSSSKVRSSSPAVKH